MELGGIRLQRVKVEKLHGCYDYEIPLSNDDHVVFITGPNGYGKTTILRIVYYLLSGRFYYFSDLLFERIEVVFSDGYSVVIGKQKRESLFAEDEESNGAKDVLFSLERDGCSHSSLVFNCDDLEKGLIEHKVTKNRIRDKYFDTNSRESFDSLFDYLESRPDSFSVLDNTDHYSAGNELILFLGNFNVYYLRDKRLMNSTRVKRLIYQSLSACSSDLSDKFRGEQRVYMNLAQGLENTFPNRVLGCETEISQTEYIALRRELSQKTEALAKYNVVKIEIPEFSERNARLLTVFIQDVKSKVGHYEPFLKKIELFDVIIQGKLFPGKRMLLNGDGGIRFVSETGKQIFLESLSSGEQQELILMYNLIFGISVRTIILIDEPETSLHITWQRLFLNDLLATTKLNQTDVIVATHSPQIVNNRWDLSVDLYGITINVEK